MIGHEQKEKEKPDGTKTRKKRQNETERDIEYRITPKADTKVVLFTIELSSKRYKNLEER